MKHLLSALLLTLIGCASAHLSGDHAGPAKDAEVCFFRDIHFSGDSFCAEPGASEWGLVESGWNDEISSISIRGGIEVTVYQHVGRQGKSLFLSQSVDDLRKVDDKKWNDRISSFKTRATGVHLSGEACFYEHPKFTGRSFCLQPGQQISFSRNDWYNTLGSVEIRGSVRVRINANFVVTASNEDLTGQDWNFNVHQIAAASPSGH